MNDCEGNNEKFTQAGWAWAPQLYSAITFSVSEPQLTLESLGSFLKTAVAEPHLPDQVNQKLWSGKQTLVFLKYRYSVVQQVETRGFDSLRVDS